MVVIITAQNEEGSEEVIVKSAKAIERDIDGLLRYAFCN